MYFSEAGVHRNIWFLRIQLIIVSGQILIIFVGGPTFPVCPLNGVEWAVSLGLAALALPLAVLIQITPVEPILEYCGVERVCEEVGSICPSSELV